MGLLCFECPNSFGCFLSFFFSSSLSFTFLHAYILCSGRTPLFHLTPFPCLITNSNMTSTVFFCHLHASLCTVCKTFKFLFCGDENFLFSHDRLMKKKITILWEIRKFHYQTKGNCTDVIRASNRSTIKEQVVSIHKMQRIHDVNMYMQTECTHMNLVENTSFQYTMSWLLIKYVSFKM